MRISDWSSDVCSSDLQIVDIGVQRITPEVEAGTQVDDLIGLHAREMAIDGAIGGVEIAGLARQRADRSANRRGDAGAEIPAIVGVGADRIDRKRVVEGKRVSERVELGVRRMIKKKNK